MFKLTDCILTSLRLRPHILITCYLTLSGYIVHLHVWFSKTGAMPILVMYSHTAFSSLMHEKYTHILPSRITHITKYAEENISMTRRDCRETNSATTARPLKHVSTEIKA